jgi:hypothetical protein
VQLEERPVQRQVVDAGAGQVAALPGVELGAQPLADPAGGRAADARVLAEDLRQHRLDIAVRQPSHPAGDDQGLQRVGHGDALPEQLVAQGGVGVAQLGALQLDRSQRGLQGAGLLPAVAVARRAVGGPPLVAVTAKLLADDLLDELWKVSRTDRRATCSTTLSSSPPEANSSWIWARMASVGDTRAAMGVGPPS